VWSCLTPVQTLHLLSKLKKNLACVIIFGMSRVRLSAHSASFVYVFFFFCFLIELQILGPGCGPPAAALMENFLFWRATPRIPNRKPLKVPASFVPFFSVREMRN
jgi:hypothetical protein